MLGQTLLMQDWGGLMNKGKKHGWRESIHNAKKKLQAWIMQNALKAFEQWEGFSLELGKCREQGRYYLPPMSFKTTKEPMQLIVCQKVDMQLVKGNPEVAERMIKNMIALEIGKQLIERDAVILSRTEDSENCEIVFRAELLVLLP